MKSFISFGLSGLLLLSIFSEPQDTALQVLTRLQDRSNAVSKQVDVSDEKRELARSILEAANNLRDKWEQLANKRLPEPYLKSLRFDVEILDRALAEPNAENVADELRYVRDDLTLKNMHAQKVVGAGGTLGASVRVTVKTIRAGQPVTGYLVRCNPKRHADLDPAMFVFNNETNPTTVSSLPPGNYEMWVEMPVRTKLRSKPVTIGGDGALTSVITFEVP